MELPSDDPWVSYARTVVEIIRPDAPNVVVGATGAGTFGVWPWPFDEPVHILTAWDPGGERLGPRRNRQRQASLERELGPLADGIWRAIGVDPVTGHREEGVAVSDVSEVDARRLGAHYDQDAIFAWSPQVWAIVECNGPRRLACGWSLVAPVPSHGEPRCGAGGA